MRTHILAVVAVAWFVFGSVASGQISQRDMDLEFGRKLFGETTRKGNKYHGPLGNKNPTEYQVGDWGRLKHSVIIINIVSTNEFLALPLYTGSQPWLFRGFPTAGLTDGMRFGIEHPLVCSTTWSYDSVRQGRKTVLVMERDDAKVDELANGRK